MRRRSATKRCGTVPQKTLTHWCNKEQMGGRGCDRWKKFSCHLHGSNRASTADSMEKNTECPSKNVRKNSLLFLDGVYKNFYLRAKNSRSCRSSAVPPLHIIVLRSSRMRGKKGQVRRCVRGLTGELYCETHVCPLRGAEMKCELIYEWVYFVVAAVIQTPNKISVKSKMIDRCRYFFINLDRTMSSTLTRKEC